MLLADTAALLMLRISLIGVIINCSEILFSHEDYSRHGVLNWEVVKTAYRWATSTHISRVLDGILAYPRFLFLVAGLVLASTVVILDVWPQWRLWFLFAVVAGWLLIQLRILYGLDGSDQILSIVLIAMLFYHLTPEPIVQIAAMAFVAGQLILSYVTAGVAKLISSDWRSGSAMPGIMRTRSYGTSRLAHILWRWPVAARALCYGIIAFECLAWLAIFVNTNWCLAFIIAGVAFHLATAVLMGLNCFLWGFSSTFPAVYMLSQGIEGWKHGADFLTMFT